MKDIPILLNLFQQEVFGPKKWNILWIVFFAALVWRRKSLWNSSNFYVTLYLTFLLFAYFAAYMTVSGDNLYFYVNTTISRFMLHFVGPVMLLFANIVFGQGAVDER
jgi:hypothetical protein